MTNVFVCSRFYNFVAVFVNDSQNLVKSQEWWDMKITPFGADTYFGELDEKNTGRNHWKRNNFTWNLLEKRAVSHKALGYHTHLLQYCFCQILEQSNPCEKALLSMSFGKCPLNFMFLVSPNDKRFYSHLGTSVGPSQKNILFTSYYQNISFRNTVLSQKFEAHLFLLLISCQNFAIRSKLQKSSEI